MSKPKPIRAGDTYMAQKQCYGQEFRLVPAPEVNQVLLFCLAYFAEKFQIDLHDFFFMSNHDHVTFTAPLANGPLFLGSLHSLAARAINSKYGDTDAMWSVKPCSAPVLQDGETKIQKCVYTLVNAVEAELVRYTWDWPGVSSWSLEYDRPITIRKPDFFFSKDMPDEVTLVIRRPPGVRPDLDDRQLRAHIRELVKIEQGKIAKRVHEEGRTFLGKRRILRCPRHATPRRRPIREGIHPLVATKDAALRIAAIERNAAFRAAHESARLRRKAGDLEVKFPYGTYLARIRYGVPCDGPDP